LPALERRPIGSSREGRLRRFHRIQKLAAGDEHHSGAGEGEQPAAPAGVGFEIEPPAFDGAQRDRVDHQPRFEAGLDREQAANLPEHCHSLTSERRDGRFEPEIS
jgi:hypothetical protein